MAEKSISSMMEVESLADTDMLVVSAGGETKKVSVKTLKDSVGGGGGITPIAGVVSYEGIEKQISITPITGIIPWDMTTNHAQNATVVQGTVTDNGYYSYTTQLVTYPFVEITQSGMYMMPADENLMVTLWTFRSNNVESNNVIKSNSWSEVGKPSLLSIESGQYAALLWKYTNDATIQPSAVTVPKLYKMN